MAAGPAAASTTGNAVTGTVLVDPASAFSVEVTATSGLSFGTITLANDGLSLTPTSFQFGPQTGGSGSTSGSITLLLTPTQGTTAISGLVLQELGDYWLQAASQTSSILGVNFNLQAGGAVAGSGHSNALQDTGALGPTGTFNFTAWSLSGQLNAGGTGGWQLLAGGDVSLTLTNQIYWNLASTDSGFLEKKGAGVALDVMTSTGPSSPPVPLPAAIWLFGLALPMLAWGGGRRARP
jgi:hypothetical protein